jgi:hypothetical protein
MKWILLSLLLCASAAGAADHYALVFVRIDLVGHRPADFEKIQQTALQEVLYTDLPCTLPLVDTRGMHKYFSRWLVSQGDACWYQTLGGGYTVLYNSGHSTHAGPGILTAMFRMGQMHDDGTVTVSRLVTDKDLD